MRLALDGGETQTVFGSADASSPNTQGPQRARCRCSMRDDPNDQGGALSSRYNDPHARVDSSLLSRRNIANISWRAPPRRRRGSPSASPTGRHEPAGASLLTKGCCAP